MKGVILCTKCRKKMQKNVCTCGNPKCLIRIYWNGQHYEYRRDNEGDVLTYDKALKKLIDISHAIKTKKFNPYYFSDSAIASRKFEKQFENYINEKKLELINNEISHEHFRHIMSSHKNYFGFFEGLDVSEINLSILSEFKATMIKKGLKSKTQKNILNILHNFFSWLRKNETIKAIPLFPEIKNTDKARRTALTREEQERGVMNLPEKHRDPIVFAMHTGVRPSELVAILVESIDLQRRLVWIERAKPGSILVEKTKNKEILPIPLNDTALAIVIKHMQNKFPKDFLFINPNTKKPYTRWFLWDLWKQFSGTNVTLYEATRHSFCTQIVPVADRLTAQRLMRHKNTSSTDNYYHAYSNTLLDAVKKIDHIPSKVVDISTIKKETKKLNIEPK